MIQKIDTPIRSLDYWARLAGPKSPSQWKDHRSAKECARAWLGEGAPPAVPPEILRVLATHPDFNEIEEWRAESEAQVPFDAYSGPANIDMLLSARDGGGRFVVVTEAKADETFGPLVPRALSAALERRLASPGSKGLDRIEELVSRVLGPAAKGEPRLHRIRYQLLTAVAAAAAEAGRQEAERAVVMVHEFETPLTTQKKRLLNQRDLVQFLARLEVEGPGAGGGGGAGGAGAACGSGRAWCGGYAVLREGFAAGNGSCDLI